MAKDKEQAFIDLEERHRDVLAAMRRVADELSQSYGGIHTLPEDHPARVAYAHARQVLGIEASRGYR